jgi:hypothetical protein
VDVLSALVPLCGNAANRARLESYLSDRLSYAADSWRKKREHHALQALQLRIVKLFDGQAAADKYAERHLENPDFRRTTIQSAIAQGQHECALARSLRGSTSTNCTNSRQCF